MSNQSARMASSTVEMPDQRTKAIMLVIRRALLMIVAAIEKAYDLDPGERIVIVLDK